MSLYDSKCEVSRCQRPNKLAGSSLKITGKPISNSRLPRTKMVSHASKVQISPMENGNEFQQARFKAVGTPSLPNVSTRVHLAHSRLGHQSPCSCTKPHPFSTSAQAKSTILPSSPEVSPCDKENRAIGSEKGEPTGVLLPLVVDI